VNRVVLAANNGELGGGEVMLLATARMLRELGHEVEVVGPVAPDGVLDRAAADGMTVHGLPAGRGTYLRALRGWTGADGRSGDLLWCHGLVPSLATAGRRNRIVHLHQLPLGAHRAALAAARAGASAVLGPSQWVADRVPGARVLPNWTADPGFRERTSPGEPRRLGYLGRFSLDKGLGVLAEALRSRPDLTDVTLVLAGAPRFVDESTTRAVEDALGSLGPRVRRLGWVAPERLLHDVDGLVVPSTAPESFGLAAAEAMAAGVPCVVSDAGALPEVVGAGHPWVARSGDPRSLADALGAWVAADRVQLRTVAQSQRARWEREYSPAAARPRVEATIDGVVGSTR
jgi:glycosyltransferase involved in cell wall biosynthesis